MLKKLIKFLCITYFFLLVHAVLAEKQCSVCEKSFAKFERGGLVIKREQASCPHCHAYERHRHLWYFLRTQCPFLFSEHLTLLHWAPEKIFASKFQNMKNIEYIPADIEPHRYESYAPNVRRLDITQIALDNESVDAIICSHVLEHIPDDAKALKEMYRVLKPNGWAIILVPQYPLDKTYENPNVKTAEERLLHYDQKDHVRKYGRDFIQRLRKANFEVEPYLVKDLPANLQKLYGLDEYTHANQAASSGADIYFCRKVE